MGASKPFKSPILSLVVAIAKNRAIGKDNQLLWHLPNDLRFFKQTTTGGVIVMGRKTFESIGKPLPNRRNLVISRQSGYTRKGIEVYSSLECALAACQGVDEIFIVGGGEIYKQALPLAQKIYLTRVEIEPEADAYFPEWGPQGWKQTWHEAHSADERHPYAYSFEILEREI